MKRHRFDPFSFLIGSLFLSVGASAMFADGAEAVNPGRLLAIATIAAGGTLVAWVSTRAVTELLRRRQGEAATVDAGIDADGPEPALSAGNTEPMPAPRIDDAAR